MKHIINFVKLTVIFAGFALGGCASAQSISESDLEVNSLAASIARGNLARHVIGGPSYEKLYDRKKVLVVFSSFIPEVLENRESEAIGESVNVKKLYEVNPGKFCDVMTDLLEKFPKLAQFQVLITLYNRSSVSRTYIDEWNAESCSYVSDLDEVSVLIINPA